ncbi:unnamed protein product [Somion occarium]|uniref:C3H1-type domain-containing protein n=1 Tax=Somion occarium TaxID=3059160 RepID=A0ABP1CHN7_9APHY
MVSALWKACADGDLDRVSHILNEESFDIEIKDHTGVTPLICAVQSGHLEIVRLLLDKGADPHNVSSQGPPEQYTADQGIIELIIAAKNKTAPNGHSYDSGYSNDGQVDPAKAYYPPPGAYYYPGIPPPVLPEGAVAFYPPPVDPSGNGLSNLPPPDVARMIPCRYYPACRYGASCMFAHPQGPYIQGPLPPPAQYPAPYESMGPAPFPAYYQMPPPSYPPHAGGPPSMNPTSPPPGQHHPLAHARSGSELVSPVQAPFSPSGIPPQGPYGIVSPVSPTFGHPGPIPVSIPPPPVHHSAGPQSPQHIMYQPTSPTGPGSMSAPQYMMPRDSGHQYPPQGPLPNGHMEGIMSPKLTSTHPMDGYHRDSMTHHRRGSARRLSMGGRGKPPCLFFPSGRCRNGDDCRFPHVLPDGPLPHQVPHFNGRGGHRPRASTYVNGYVGLEDKLASMNIQDQQQQHANGIATENSSRSQSTDPGSRGRAYSGFKPNQFINGHRTDRRVAAPRPQRLPSADEFPVLAGTSTPPLRSPGANGVLVNGQGPTAAQVLQAPPPVRKEKDNQSSTRGSSPNSEGPERNAKEENSGPNGVSAPASHHEPVVSKLPVSFAAAATAAVPEVPKEVSVSA